MFETLTEKLRNMRGEQAGAPEVEFKPYPEQQEETTVETTYEKIERQNSTPMVANTGDEGSNIELKVVRPAAFEEVGTIADYLLEGCTVVLNLEVLDAASITRMLDFLNGVTYSTDGDIKNVSRSTYIITPHNVDISDDK